MSEEEIFFYLDHQESYKDQTDEVSVDQLFPFSYGYESSNRDLENIICEKTTKRLQKFLPSFVELGERCRIIFQTFARGIAKYNLLSLYNLRKLFVGGIDNKEKETLQQLLDELDIIRSGHETSEELFDLLQNWRPIHRLRGTLQGSTTKRPGFGSKNFGIIYDLERISNPNKVPSAKVTAKSANVEWFLDDYFFFTIEEDSEEIVEALNKEEQIPAKLKKNFQQYGVILQEEKHKILHEGSEWRVNGPKKRYIVKKESNDVKVYIENEWFLDTQQNNFLKQDSRIKFLDISKLLLISIMNCNNPHYVEELQQDNNWYLDYKCDGKNQFLKSDFFLDGKGPFLDHQVHKIWERFNEKGYYTNSQIIEVASKKLIPAWVHFHIWFVEKEH